MKRITRPMHIIRAVSGLLVTAACGAAVAGEPRTPLPTEPTLFYACMSTGGRSEYDSAAFAWKNPGPVYQDHYDLNLKMTTAFDEHLTRKYGFHGLVQCGQYKTLAEAKQWLQWRESEARARPGVQHVATNWAFDAAPTESGAAAPGATTTTDAATQKAATASATTTTHDATSKASQPAAPAATQPTAFFVCAAVANRVEYDSSVFEARNDAATSRQIMFKFAAHLGEKYQVGAMPICTPKPTREAAQAHLEAFAAGVYGGVTQHVATGWVYEAKQSQSAQPAASSAAVAGPTPAATPVMPQAVPRKPATPPSAAPPTAVKPAAPAAAAAQSAFVVCKADGDPRARYYNPPVDGGDGGYETWQPSYQSFLQHKYRYQRHVACNKLPTRAEAQDYFKAMVDQANLNKQINGIPSPVIITNWQFK